ncbi:myxosortase-dependent M36 family metallopeptidase [Hyalangium rubrum]|uniref:Myxosortase-dependent M36 family metallopeptidase n=1 Tax=Hyalangium rubrum TaxID=3103134 RepID=A0ABU5H4R4_9BACT|nr:myxosortase-dependent M36 family metallopeptidase [Hyalangium sp. s54d21]MDY7227080.1 myxosortase-dependent M36 family metallopeptidase [Hyalangium sp. s54d21]
MKRWLSAISGLLLAASGPSASAKDLPNIDTSFDGEGAPRAESRLQLQSKVKGARISGFEARTGTPTFIWGNTSQVDDRLKSALQRMSPEQAARVHMGLLAKLYKLSPQVASALKAEVRDMGRGATLVTFHQDVDGVEVFRQQVRLLLNERREVVAISGRLAPHASSTSGSPKLAFRLDAPAAIAKAFADLNGEQLDPASLVLFGKPKGAYTSFELAPAAVSRHAARMVTPARAKRVFFPLADQLVPAWYLELNTGAAGRTDSDYYSYVISAKDGQLLFRNNLTVSDAYSYRVWAHPEDKIPYDGPQGLAGTPHPTGTPNGYQAPFVAPELITLENTPFSADDPWLPAGATETVGNNIDAYADISGADGKDAEDFRADVTAPGAFDRVYDVTLEPDASLDQQKAAVTQLFYVTNFLHDWFYDYGFDEAAGNAQADNYGRGGVAGDSLKAEAQDFSGLNNANMSTPADGGRPRMQMYLFTPNVEISLKVLSPASIARAYSTNTAAFGPLSFEVTGQMVLVQDAGGGSLTDGCEVPFANAAAVSGKIAVIDRGTCGFAIKTKNAQDAGAAAVIIVNNAAGAPPGMGGSDPSITIPTLSLSLADGNLIKPELPNGVTVRMFAGEPDVYRDGSLDNAVVAHEWGHYISNRLIGNASGLGNNQGRSMGEGWADFHALLMEVRAEDKGEPGNNTWQGAYATGGYASSGGGNDGYLYALRRFPYSTDFAKNPLTFKHIENGVALPTTAPISPDSGGVNSEVHNSGEVWASMLWECYASLLNTHAFAEAQERMKTYVVRGYLLTPSSPTFLEARDAFLAGVYALDKADFRKCHAAFARRGAGLRAKAPARGSTSHAGVVESFSTGKDVDLTSAELTENSNACDADMVLDNKEAGVVLVELTNTGTERLTQSTAHVSAAAGTGLTFANGGRVNFPALEPFESAIGEIAVTLDGATGIELVDIKVTYGDEGQSIPGTRDYEFKLRVNSDDALATSASDDVESRASHSAAVWTASHDMELGDYQDWERHEEAADVHYHHGADAPLAADSYLVSPGLEVGSTGDFRFTFKHRYTFEGTAAAWFDGGVIEISTDGGLTWTDIGASIASGQGYVGEIETGGDNPIEGRMAYSGTSSGYPNWLDVNVNLGTAYQGQTVKLRFRIGTDLGVGANGWDIDNLVFTGITNTPFPTLVPEQDTCEGNTPPVANAGADQTVLAGAAVALSGSATDADNDTLSYSWAQTGGTPVVALEDSATRTPTFTAPAVTASTVLTFTMTVNDGGSFVTDSVNVTVRPPNVAPMANAGEDRTVDEGTAVALDARGSSDADGDTLTYAWEQTAGTAVTLSDATTAQPGFTAPSVEADAVFTFEVTVSDGTLSAKDTVSITVRNVTESQNRAPTASAGADRSVNEGATVTLSGAGTDADGDALTYAWTQTAGPSVTLMGANTASASFTAPDVDSNTVLTFSLKVTDAQGASGEDTVSIAVQPRNDNGGGGGDEEDGGGCGCSSNSSAASSLMPLLMIGMALLSRRRRWLK